MPIKNKTKSTHAKDEQEVIPIVDTDTLAVTVIELLGDVRVASELKAALYPQELLDKIDALTSRLSTLIASVKVRDERIKVRDERIKVRDERIKKLEHKVAALDADKVEQYSRRPNLRFSGIPDTGETTENTHARTHARTHVGLFTKGLFNYSPDGAICQCFVIPSLTSTLCHQMPLPYYC